MILIIGAWVLIVLNALNALLAFGLTFNDEERMTKGVGKLLSNILYSSFVIVTILGLMS